MIAMERLFAIIRRDHTDATVKTVIMGTDEIAQVRLKRSLIEQLFFRSFGCVLGVLLFVFVALFLLFLCFYRGKSCIVSEKNLLESLIYKKKIISVSFPVSCGIYLISELFPLTVFVEGTISFV